MSLGSLRMFLATAKRTLQAAKSNPQNRLNFVIGNESCDLDSVTSALIYAYFGSHLTKSSLSTNGQSLSLPLIPLLNIPRDEIAIRPELLTLLRYTDLEPSSLLSLDDMQEYGSNLSPEQTSWILVDHNALTGPLADKFANRVVGCIDHHIDEQKIPKTEDAPRIIETSGSCTSLIANHFRGVWDQLTQSASSVPAGAQSDVHVGADDMAMRTSWDAALAKLAMASILVDTQNLENKHKTVESDVQAVQYLQSKIDSAQWNSAGQFDRARFFREIDDAKSDVSNMNVYNCLRKDYKQWTEAGQIIGVTTVVTSLKVLMEKSGSAENLEKEIERFSTDKHIDICAVMTAFINPNTKKFHRELLILPINEGFNSFGEGFETKSGEQLQLQKHELSLPNSHSKVWWQTNLAASRKQVAPLLRDNLRARRKASPAENKI